MKKVLLFLLISTVCRAQITPSFYYQFENNLGGLTAGNTNYSFQNGAVGRCIEYKTSQFGNFLDAQALSPSTAISVQFLFKRTYNTGKNDYVMLFRSNVIKMQMYYPFIHINTTHPTIGNSEFIIDMNGINRKSWGYLNDGSWHHVALVFNAIGGKVELYIDGESPNEFKRTIPANSNIGSGAQIQIGSSNIHEQPLCMFDEFAVYLGALTAGQVYKNYQEFLLGQHFTATSTTVPSYQNATGSGDPLEYSIAGTQISQLQSYPLPRYARNNQLKENFNWVDLQYFGGRFQLGVSSSQAVAASVAVNEELTKNWRYGLYATLGNDEFGIAWRNQANSNPQKKLNIITLRRQIGSKLTDKNLANQYYLQNSSGQFLDFCGNVTNNINSKEWRPSTDALFYSEDGTTQKTRILNAGFTRPINNINENSEVIAPLNCYNAVLDSNSYAKDLEVLSQKNSSGFSWVDYISERYFLLETKGYRDSMLSTPLTTNTFFSTYTIDGSNYYRFEWNRSRKINSTYRGQYYACPDLYPRYPNNWYFRQGAWRGLEWVYRSRFREISLGDKLFSPFVGAGWNETDATKDITPPQWIGLLKIMSGYGAEFFYTGYFHEASTYNPPAPPPMNPASYAWQLAAPPYVQAITSKAQDYLLNGVLLDGDYPYLWAEKYLANYSKPRYLFYAGDERLLVAVRKLNGANKYYITSSLMRNSNQKYNTESSKVATIVLGGDTVLFNVRQQGSCYLYDNTIVDAPKFVQLDSWHDSTHFSNWTSNIEIEAEVYDSSISSTTKTTNYTGRNFTSFKTFQSGGTLEYDIEPRTVGTKFFYVNARVTDTIGNSNIDVYLDGVLKGSINCIKQTSFNWYKYNSLDSLLINFTNLTAYKHTVKLVLSPKIEVDKILVSASSSIYTSSVTACGQVVINTPTSNINYSGSLNICHGQTKQLTAVYNGVASSYLWSNGATTQSINATGGVYTVTISGSYGTAVSGPLLLNVNPSPVVSISQIPTDTICSGTYVLTTSGTGVYQWSNGATAQSMAVINPGVYTVTVTDANGCSGSASTNVVYRSCDCPIPTGLIFVYRVNWLRATYRALWQYSNNPITFAIELNDGVSTTVTNVTGSSRQKTFYLKKGTNYIGRIRSTCTSTATSPYSAPVNFKTF